MSRIFDIMFSAVIGTGLACLLFLCLANAIEFIFDISLIDAIGMPSLLCFLIALIAYFSANAGASLKDFRND